MVVPSSISAPFARAPIPPPNAIPNSEFSSSPVNFEAFYSLLTPHPDQDLVHYVVSGLALGFSIGFCGDLPESAAKNLRTAYQHSQAVSTAIALEVSRGHTSGPHTQPPFLPFHLSPIGAVIKKDGSARLILDLSSPRGSAVNEGIDPALATVKYCSFDDALVFVHQAGPGAFMAKADIKHAFRLCPVHPDDWGFLGFQWDGKYYFDLRLPFGSRSSPYIFNSFADLVCWILINVVSILLVLHYLDDFFLCHSSFHGCNRDLSNLISLFKQLSIPLAEEKVEGPSTTITFLGIEIDSIANTIRLPAEKFSDLMDKINFWHSRSKCTKRELLSLIGSLSFACKVVKCGRFFLRRLIDLSSSADRLHHFVSLNAAARADIQWWLDFLPTWNGVELIQAPPISSFDIELSTDASSIGIGAVCGTHWFSYTISDFSSMAWLLRPDAPFDINFWELFALVSAVFTWGESWANKQIIIFVDNLSVSLIWCRGSKCPYMMRLIRQLFLFSASRNINILVQHIPGHSNIHADLLSRLQVPQFKASLPTADQAMTPLPDLVWRL